MALPGFHSYTGCDTTSAFVREGNPLKLLQKHTSFILTFQDISKYPDPSEETLECLESFTCLTYCGRLAESDVNLLRYAKFQEQLTMKPGGKLLSSYSGVDMSLLPPHSLCTSGGVTTRPTFGEMLTSQVFFFLLHKALVGE